MTDDYMGRAIALARHAQGLTSPNPPVGAVLVKDGGIVGEGFTLAAGHEHAEIVALQRAGQEARGATLFVTLEPCSHWGRTPPCADALVSAGIAAAHVATPDPNPRVNGEGIRRLEQHGIPVTLGEHAPEAIELAEAHARYVRCGLPFVTLLLDAPAQVAASMQAQTDAILTDLVPPPRPPIRSDVGVRPPLVVLASSAGWIPNGTDRMMVVLPEAENRHLHDLAEDSRVLYVPTPENGIDFSSVLQELGRHEITRCLAMGTEALAVALLERDLVNKIVAGPNYSPPAGFEIRHQPTQPAPHLIMYPSQ